MKKASISSIMAAVLTAAIILSGCGATGPGSLVSEEKDFTDFTHVDVGSAFKVEITRSDSFSIIISADESLVDCIEVSRGGETLKIY